MSDCIFCKIIAKELPSERIYEDNDVIAFNDINPQSPEHILVIPKNHFKDFVSMVAKGSEKELLSLFNAVKNIVQNKGLDKNGFRLVINNGKEAGQAVDHVHIHILSGRKMNWPPG